ncbi:DegQ family serine endoprotease [Thermodesulfobacteriota bacterium]
MNPKKQPQKPHVYFSIRFLLLAGIIWLTSAGQTLAANTAPNSFADIAEKLGPTVVNVYTTQVLKSSRSPHEKPPHGQEIPELFRKFFELPDNFGQHPQRERKRTSLGSGVIHSADGYIITNNHVIEDADTINVRLTNNEEYDAKIIGRDPKTDVALIKIEPKNALPFAEFGDSDSLRVGDWVMAIGNPFGLEHTVTAGIVSAKGRSIGNGPYENFIQTDASINLGNSGGPLFNLQGKMVGINTAIYSRSGGNIGLGFAIPVNMAKHVIEQLKEEGQVTRGWLGVMIQHVTNDLANQFGLERPIGALVGEVIPGSPADKAGIKSGDIIIEYQGKEVSQMTMLPAMVAQTPVGSKETITLVRNGKRKQINVVIDKLEEEHVGIDPSVAEEENTGLNLQELTPELAESLGIDEKKGLLITSVEPDSPAAEAGLRRGDVILEVNQSPVADLKTYNSIVGKAKNTEKLLYLITRNQHTRFVVMSRGEK